MINNCLHHFRIYVRSYLSISSGLIGISGLGQESKLEYFFSRTSKDGRVSLVYHTVVDGGARCAAECSCTKWGQTEIPPQAGIEFFDRVSDGEKRLFKAVRIYDDIEQPTASVDVQ